MRHIEKRYIDWEKTAMNLRLLRLDDLNLRRYVCRELKYDKQECEGNCETCKFEMDKSISQEELATVFDVSSNILANWENNRSIPSLEELIFYSDICQIDLFDVIIFEKRDEK